MSERPVECSHCKRALYVTYKEIVGGNITETQMCAECPILQQKLHGRSDKFEGAIEAEKGLCCGVCRTTLESVQTGNPVGCVECYSVFADVILSLLPKRFGSKRNQPLHVGRTPSKPISSAVPTSQITTLNEALSEALKRENYEQAAWLRDQIKSLTEKPSDGKS